MLRRPQEAAGALNKRAPPVRLGRKILAHLRRWHRMDGDKCAMVVHYNGQQIDSPHASWKRALREAEIKNFTLHGLRHTCATWKMQAGANIWSLAGFLGMTVKTLEAVYGHHHLNYQDSVADL